jgi:hypothetical protein
MIMHYLNGRKVSFENERTDLDISKKLKATYNLESKKVPDPWSMVEIFGMVGINVPIPVPVAYHSFGGWKCSAFGDLNQYGTDSIRFLPR